jgi:hypothetical protein
MGQGASSSLGAEAIEQASKVCAGGWIIALDGTRAVATGATEPLSGRAVGRC